MESTAGVSEREEIPGAAPTTVIVYIIKGTSLFTLKSQVSNHWQLPKANGQERSTFSGNKKRARSNARYPLVYLM